MNKLVFIIFFIILTINISKAETVCRVQFIAPQLFYVVS